MWLTCLVQVHMQVYIYVHAFKVFMIKPRNAALPTYIQSCSHFRMLVKFAYIHYLQNSTRLYRSLANPLVPKTRSSCRKTLILIYVARYETLIRILVIWYFFQGQIRRNHICYIGHLNFNIKSKNYHYRSNLCLKTMNVGRVFHSWKDEIKILNRTKDIPCIIWLWLGSWVLTCFVS